MRILCCLVYKSRGGQNLQVRTVPGGKGQLEVWPLFHRYLGGGERLLRGVTESKLCFKKVNLLSTIAVSRNWESLEISQVSSGK